MNAFQQRLHERRKQRNMTLQDLRKAARMPYSTVWRIIYGDNVRAPNEEQLRKLADALDLPLFTLQAEALEAYHGVRLRRHVSEDMETLIAYGEELSPRNLRLLIGMAEQFLREDRAD